MALVKVVKGVINDPQTLDCLYKTFHNVEEIPYQGENEPLYKTFRVQGQGVPKSDKYIFIQFERNLQGQVKITGWDLADSTTGLYKKDVEEFG